MKKKSYLHKRLIFSISIVLTGVFFAPVIASIYGMLENEYAAELLFENPVEEEQESERSSLEDEIKEWLEEKVLNDEHGLESLYAKNHSHFYILGSYTFVGSVPTMPPEVAFC